MSLFKKDKEKDRYYLFAGMGGAPARRKQKVMLGWSLLAGLLVSIGLALSLYFFNLLR
jgi:hypothetical protein